MIAEESMDEILNAAISSHQKRLRGSDEDKISKLPDSLLQHILSFVSTRDAVRTSLLSHRWRNLWMLVPCLELDTEEFLDEADFYKFMDRFLYLRFNSHLQKFRVKCALFERKCSCFESWIDTAIMCKLEHLEVDSYRYSLDDDRVEMPPSFFTCNTLVVLKLDCTFFLDVPKSVSLSNLKTMQLYNVMFADDISFKSLISGCPVLEELRVYRPSEDNLKGLCVCSHTLKRLIILTYKFDDGKEYGVVIDAPNLEHLHLDDHLSESFIISNIGSSCHVRLDVHFNRDYKDELEADDVSVRNSIRRLFTGISNARWLIIDLETVELLCQYRKFEALPQFHNLIQLKTELSKSTCKVLPAILECCPNLKFLILDLCEIPEINPLRLSPAAPQRMLSSLWSIWLGTPIIGDAVEMNMIKYFLEKSVVLKVMNVCLCEDLNQEKELHILKELLTFPRRSKVCEVYVEQ